MLSRIIKSPTFEDVKIFTSNLGDLKYGAAFALPGIGIFINPNDIKNTDLLRHEFGHILQARIWGYTFFYAAVVSASIKSAHKANHNTGFNHQHTWTEWTANWFAYNYFKMPQNWNVKKYPISPPQNNSSIADLPMKVRELVEEIKAKKRY